MVLKSGPLHFVSQVSKSQMQGYIPACTTEDTYVLNQCLGSLTRFVSGVGLWLRGKMDSEDI